MSATLARCRAQSPPEESDHGYGIRKRLRKRICRRLNCKSLAASALPFLDVEIEGRFAVLF